MNNAAIGCTRCVLCFVAGLCLWGCQSPSNTHSDRLAHQHLAQAQRFLEQGLTDSAFAAFGLALEQNPELTPAYLGMGGIYRQRGHYALAARSYEQALSLSPNNDEAYHGLGVAKQLAGLYRDAIRAYLRALEIQLDRFDTNRNLAGAYLQIGEPDRALAYAQRASQLDPESQSAWANLAAVYSGLGRYDHAVNAYRRATELGALKEPILFGLADAHLQLHHYTRAMAVLQSINRLRRQAAAYERIGYAQYKLRRFGQALVSFRTAVSLDDRDTAALNSLGVCLMTQYLQSGRTMTEKRREALQAWRASLGIQADQTRIIDLLNRYERL